MSLKQYESRVDNLTSKFVKQKKEQTEVAEEVKEQAPAVQQESVPEEKKTKVVKSEKQEKKSALPEMTLPVPEKKAKRNNRKGFLLTDLALKNLSTVAKQTGNSENEVINYLLEALIK